MEKSLIGVLGGSGMYSMPGLLEVSEHRVKTPYGDPSDALMTGRFGGTRIAFLARHGRGHRLLPGEVPYRANIYALRALGVRYLISVSAVGSLRDGIRPLDIVLPDQFIDRTRGRIPTFFGDGVVAHVSMADPVCGNLTASLAEAFRKANLAQDVQLHDRGTYVCIDGPAFSTRAESLWYQGMGADVIGMTAMPEAKLAREAQMAYANLALVTDFDAWHPSEEAVTAEIAIANLARNTENAQRILSEAIVSLANNPPDSAAHVALASAMVTQPDQLNTDAFARLDVLLRSNVD